MVIKFTSFSGAGYAVVHFRIIISVQPIFFIVEVAFSKSLYVAKPDDIITGIKAACTTNSKYDVFNLGNHKSENLMDMIGMIEENLGKKAKIDFQPMQPGDIPESFADIDKSIKLLNFKPITDISKGIPKFINWYKEYHQL